MDIIYHNVCLGRLSSFIIIIIIIIIVVVVEAKTHVFTF